MTTVSGFANCGKFGVIHPAESKLVKIPNVMHYMRPSVVPKGLMPDSVKYSRRCPAELWGMLGNQLWGNCVEVTIANDLNVKRVNSDIPAVPYAEDEVVSWYEEITDFDRHRPETDRGTDPVDALIWAQLTLLIRAWGQIDLTNDAQVAGAIAAFGGQLGRGRRVDLE
jgi:hypothetical protein